MAGPPTPTTPPAPTPPAPTTRLWLRPLLNLFSRYPLLLLVVLIFQLIVWGVLMDGFEAAHVLWNDDPEQAFLAGLFAAGLCGLVFGFVCWLDSVPVPNQTSRGPGVTYVAAAAVTAGIAVLPAVFLGSLFESTLNGVEIPIPRVWGVPTARVLFPAGVAVAVALGFFGWWWVKRAENNPPWWLKWSVPLTVLGGYAVMSVIHFCYPSFVMPGLAAPLVGLLLLGLFAFAGAGIHRATRSPAARPYVYPIFFAAIALMALFGGQTETEYRTPGLEDYWENRVALDQYEQLPPGADGGLLDDDQTLNAWRARVSKAHPGPRQPVIIVTVSGGASTSAVYTARSLFRLEARYPGVCDRVRIISGASGGMLGAAYCVTQLRAGGRLRDPIFTEYANRRAAALSGDPNASDFAAWEKNYWEKEVPTREDAFIRGLEEDYLSSVLQKWVHHDIPRSILGGSTTNDRGMALERTWDRHLKGRAEPPDVNNPSAQRVFDPNAPALDVPFQSLRAEEARGEIPSLIFSPMMVEDGRQLLISNLNLDYMTTAGSLYDSSYGTNDQARTYSAVEFFRLFPKADHFTLRTAVRLNATFPVLSPAAALPTNPPRRVVDAGYYDNYGLLVAARWIERHEKWLAETKTEVWVLPLWVYGYAYRAQSLVSAGEGALLAKNRKRGRPNRLAMDGYSYRSSTFPVNGLFAAWKSNMIYRGDERLNLVLNRINTTNPGMASRYIRDVEAELPMNWVLSSNSRQRIRAEVERFDKLAQFSEFLATGYLPAMAPPTQQKAFVDAKREAEKEQATAIQQEQPLDTLTEGPIIKFTDKDADFKNMSPAAMGTLREKGILAGELFRVQTKQSMQAPPKALPPPVRGPAKN